jgi:hypothetical protein
LEQVQKILDLGKSAGVYVVKEANHGRCSSAAATCGESEDDLVAFIDAAYEKTAEAHPAKFPTAALPPES